MLHLGRGAGYYTAIAAELVGSVGRITAVEINTKLAERARAALALWPQVTVSNAEAPALPSIRSMSSVSAGATHPLQSWLDALKPSGRLVFPMTARSNGFGTMLFVTRVGPEPAARFLLRVGFIDF